LKVNKNVTLTNLDWYLESETEAHPVSRAVLWPWPQTYWIQNHSHITTSQGHHHEPSWL